jgi:hypothetical protein
LKCSLFDDGDVGMIAFSQLGPYIYL